MKRLSWRWSLALGVGLLVACFGIPLIQLFVATASFKGWATVLTEFAFFMLWGLAVSAGIYFLLDGITKRPLSPK